MVVSPLLSRDRRGRGWGGGGLVGVHVDIRKAVCAVGLTDTSRSADGLVCLVAVSQEVVRQDLHVVLLSRVFSSLGTIVGRRRGELYSENLDSPRFLANE